MRGTLRWTERLALLLFAAVTLPGATSAASASAPSQAVAASPVAPPAAAVALDPSPPRAVVPVFEAGQVISLYGHPGAPVMGALGKYGPEQAAAEAARLAAEWDALNGPRGATGALHLIVDVAQPHPMADGSYLIRMSSEQITPYLDAARARGLLLFLDLQLGMADPLTEVRRLTPFLAEPFVHLALDPEFAMRAKRGVPGDSIGSLDAAEVNAVQRYLSELVRTYALPPKVLVLHQFRTDMLTGTAAFDDPPGVTRIVDMDGWGGEAVKLSHYEAYALAAYSQRPAIKLFTEWDQPLLTPARLLALPRVPDLVIYQ